MPDYFTHTIAAEKIFERLAAEEKSKIKSRTLYLLGAQGGDLFFAYHMKLSAENTGRILHKQDALSVFRNLIFGNLSYAAGWATHYALDSSLHPTVYAYTDGRHKPFIHQTFEKDIGLYVSKFYRIRRSILPKEYLMACTGPVYDSVKLLEPKITMTGVERCLKRHFKYTKYLYRTKKQTYKCDFDFSQLAGPVEDAVDYGVKCVRCVLDKDIDPDIFNREFLQR